MIFIPAYAIIFWAFFLCALSSKYSITSTAVIILFKINKNHQSNSEALNRLK